jgi:hypothetical protein
MIGCLTMKKRFSTEKSEWSDTREEWYKAECQKMAFGIGFEVAERDQKVYKVVSNAEYLFYVPAKSKMLWFETWTHLKKL